MIRLTKIKIDVLSTEIFKATTWALAALPMVLTLSMWYRACLPSIGKGM